MAKKQTFTYTDDLTGKNLPDSQVAFVSIRVGEDMYKLETHKENIREWQDKSRKSQVPGRKEGTTKND